MKHLALKKAWTIVLLLILLCGLVPAAHAADPGVGGATENPTHTGLIPQSTVNDIRITFAREYGKTSIFLRICSDGPIVQLRSEQVGQWITEIFLRTEAANGCSPSTTSWWRMVYNADPGPATFRIYATSNDTALPEAEFMQRSARYTCQVTGYGQGTCAREIVSVPRADINGPSEGQTISGNFSVWGWATDQAALAGPGVDQVQVQVGNRSLGAASYGLPRTDVASAFGDSRFTNSGYGLTFDTHALPNGPATLQVRYHSAITGAWHVMQRLITINNETSNTPPHTPAQLNPANGSTTGTRTVTLRWQDTGDPDNRPRNFRDYQVSIRNSDGSWSNSSGWQTATSWTITLPSDGNYLWKVQSGDGEAASTWSGEWTFQTAPPQDGRTLEVRYVDQVYAQQVPEANYWNHCGPSSTAMVLHYEGKESRDVLYDRQATLDLVCKVKATCSGGANLGMILNTLKQYGLDVASKWNPSIDDIRESVQRGHPVLMGIKQADHIVVAIGYKDDGTVLINDPFGGKNWWNDIEQRNDRLNGRWLTRPSTPQTKGAAVPYRYGSELGANYGVLIQGPRPTPQTAQATFSAAQGGSLSNAGTTITFPPMQGLMAQTTTTLTVTHIPQFRPAQPIDGYMAALESFRLNAVDSVGQPLPQSGQAFTLTLELDPAIVDTWGMSNGLTAPSEGREGQLSLASAQPAGQLSQALVIGAWDATEQRWVPLETTVDLANYRVTAQSASFTEFAVLIKPLYTAYLPITLR